MAQKSMPAHRDYPDAEPSYDDPDQGYDAIDADPDGGDQVDRDIFKLWPSDQVNKDDQVDEASGFPAPDVFPDSLFDDLRVVKPAKAGPGHGDS